MGVRSSLARMLPSGPDIDEMKKDVYQTHSLLTVNLHDDRLTWPEREILKQVGERLYGEAEKGNGKTSKRRA